ncbi:hypothetical protein [Nevskia soli]|uniref:hypothetical protein n=1 Tax=Nevskia soli TaxID=418856 RepID=UPI0004A6C565|nr:hypothetical protein [Nevskia soli]
MEFLAKVSALSVEICQRTPPANLGRVECDRHSVRLCMPLQVGRNRNFAWSDIAAACYADAGPDGMGVIFLDLGRSYEPAYVFMESAGAQDLFAGLIEHDIFPLARRPSKTSAAEGIAHSALRPSSREGQRNLQPAERL